MDPVSAAASVIAVIQIAQAVTSFCYEYQSSVKQAPKEAEQIIAELSSLKVVLEHVLIVARHEERSKSKELFSLGKLTVPCGELDVCREVLLELQTKLQPRSGWKGVKNALTWHFKEGELRKAIEKISKSKDTLNLAVTVDSAVISLAIQEDVTNLATSFKAVSLDANRRNALDWLAAPDSSEAHNAAQRKHQATTGTWFMNGAVFAEWKKKPKSLLWLHGIPGCGKTVLCSSIIQNLNIHRQAYLETALAYFYFDFNNPKTSTLSNFLRSVIVQLMIQRPDALPLLEKEYSNHGGGRQQPSLRILTALLVDTIPLFQDAFLVIDALDEGQERDQLLDWVADFRELDLPNLHFLVTSRKEKEIDDVLNPAADFQVLVKGSDVDPDIRLYVKDRLNRDRRLKKWSDEVKEEIEKSLMEKVNGMFRLADCQMDILCKCNNTVALRKELQSLPRTLESTYNRILTGIDEIHTDDALKVLQWLCFSGRPMLLSEMVEALAVDNRETFTFNPDLRYTDPQDMLTICSSLITMHPRNIKRDPWADKKEHVQELRLAHYSVKEYLTSDRFMKGSVASFYVQEDLASAMMAESCIIYLQQFRGYSFLNEDNISSYPLATYAAKYWSFHAQKADEHYVHSSYATLGADLLSDDEVRRNWLSLFDPESGVTVQSDLEFIDFKEPVKDKDLKKPLYYACLFGLLDTAQILLTRMDREEELDQEEGEAGTFLHAAAKSGNTALIELLLDRGANVNACGGQFVTTLQIAATEGHEEAILTLLKHGADPNVMGGYFGSALVAAAGKGLYQAASALLEHGADVNASNQDYGGALAEAASKGDEKMVELLLSHGGDINAKTQFGGPPLHNAASKGSLRVVRLLLSKGADINNLSEMGGTALLDAAMADHTEVIQYLLEQGADPNLADGLFSAPLAHAAGSGNKRAVLLLLDYGAEVDWKAGDYGTPLAEATAKGHLEIIDILLARGASAKDSTVIQSAMTRGKLDIAQKLIDHGASIHGYVGGDDGFNLHSASANGNLTMVKFLVTNKADVNAQGGIYGTALQAAACADRGALPIVAYLLSHGADVNAKCGVYGSALNAACQRDEDSPAMVELMLKNGADVNARCGRDGTALYSAAGAGNIKSMNLLLKAGADIEARSDDFSTALHWAAANERQNASDLLIKKGATINSRNERDNDLGQAAESGLTSVVAKMLDLGADLNAGQGDHATALQRAAIEGHCRTLELLLQKGADPNHCTSDSGTALHVASASDNLRSIQLLVAAGADVHRKAGDYSSALQAAAQVGEFKNLEYLLTLGVDVNYVGGEFGTALSAAAASESRNCVKALLNAGADVTLQGGMYGNALQAAAQQYMGHQDMVKLILEAGADVNARGGTYGFALQGAAQGGNLGIAKMLVAYGADVNAKGGEYGTALLAAAQGGFPDIVDFLVAKGADIHVAGPQGTALYHAADGGNEKIVRTLLDRGSDVNSGWGQAGSALSRAISSDSVAIVKLLIDRGVDVHAVCGDYSPLLQAIGYSVEGALKLLLSAGVDVNARIPKDYEWAVGEEWKVDEAANEEEKAEEGATEGEEGNEKAAEGVSAGEEEDNTDPDEESVHQPPHLNALHAAIRAENEEITQLILARTADVNVQGGEYGNALQAAVFDRHLGLVQQLLDRGADVHAKGGIYHTVLQAAACNGELKRVELILAHGADVNIEGGKWGTALQAAAVGGHDAVVMCLLDRGASVNARGGEHTSALHAAAFKGHLKTVKILLDRSADINMYDEYEGDPLTLASAEGQLEVVKLFIERTDIILNPPSERYKNPLQAATDGGFVKVVRELMHHWPSFRRGDIFDKAKESLCEGGYTNFAATIDRIARVVTLWDDLLL